MSRFPSSYDRALATKSSKWTSFITKNPSRVVAALKLGPLGPRGRATNEFGDSGEDFIFAMDAVRRLTEQFGKGGGLEVEEERKRWEGLVKVGVVEALCSNVCELKGDTMADDAMASYYPPFVMLYMAAMGIRSNSDSSSQLTETDRRVVSVIRDNWREMINRWWNEPMNTLKADSAHEPERLVVSRLLGHLLIHDSSVYEIIFDPSDHTLSLISRHWLHSTTLTVARSTLVILRSIIFFNFSSNIEEYLESHERPSLQFLMNKIYTGLGFKAEEPERLLQIMSDKLTLPTESSGGGIDEAVEYAVQDLAFAHDLYSNTDATSSGFGAALRTGKVAETYWENVFVLMQPAGTNTTSPASDALSAPSATQLTQAVLTLLLNLVLEKPQSEVAEVTRTWIHAGLFDMFDRTMVQVVRVQGAARILTFLFTSLKESAFSFPPPLLTELSSQLPRQKTVGAVIKYDMELQNASGTSSSTTNATQRTFGEGTSPSEIPDAQDPLWANGLWQALGWFQGLCHSATTEICMRRTCGNKATSRCSGCKEVGYCGVECQKLDWKEHKQICKYASPYMAAVSAGRKRLTKAKAVEMGLLGLEEGASGNAEGGAGRTTVMDRLKDLTDYATPFIFIILVIAGQYLGIFHDFGRWLEGLTLRT